MRFFLTLMFTMCFVASPYARSYILKDLPEAQKIGQYSYSYYIWDVYDITLYAQDKTLDNKSNIALSLAYKRDLNGEDISARSIEEMKKLGFKDEKYLSAWQKKMDDIFPDVKEGTVLTGIRKDNTTSFYHNGKHIGIIDDALFSEYFFAIWLSPKTSEPEMRASLLGL